MTVAITPKRDAAHDTIAMTTGSMCHDFVAALLDELRSMPGAWSTLDSARQQIIIETFKSKTRASVEKAVSLLMAGSFQAVPATLEFVNRKKGIKAGLTVKADALCRHALFDASGANVLVVIVDPEKYAQRIDEIKAKDDQLELFDPNANYDASRDQPGYRRDQDPLAPGMTWEDLKASFRGGDPDAPPPPGVPSGESLTQEQEIAAHRAMIKEVVPELGFDFRLDVLERQGLDDLRAAIAWAEAFQLHPDGCTIARPAWIEPQSTQNDPESGE